MKVSIYRFDPDRDDAPYLQDYEVESGAARGAMILDVLESLKERDPTLSYRRSCREGVCGSDGMNVNGANVLACVTPVSAVLDGGVLRSGLRLDRSSGLVIRPLPGLPVIRDLVVDMAPFWDRYRAIKPWLINDRPPPAQERRQSPKDRARLDGLYECILCGCCTSACPSWWWNPDAYVGPAGLLWALRFLMDSRDTATMERLADLDDPFSVFRCRGILNCVAYCPKGLNPRNAISKIQGLLVEEGT